MGTPTPTPTPRAILTVADMLSSGDERAVLADEELGSEETEFEEAAFEVAEPVVCLIARDQLIPSPRSDRRCMAETGLTLGQRILPMRTAQLRFQSAAPSW